MAISRYSDLTLIQNQGRSYRRISRINDTGPPSYRGPNMCNCSRLIRLPCLKKDPERIFIQGPLRATYASVQNIGRFVVSNVVLRPQSFAFSSS
ncbi:hypothetical protein TNCV_3733551 [Trichonephila clavipes]|nr:hypothetical protein TNCV_3733551 [Trichonephila clavipes]